MNDEIQKPTPSESKETKPIIEDPEIAALVETLGKAGIANSETLTKKLEASRQAGQMANMLGESRKEIERLSRLIESQQQNQRTDSYDVSDNNSIDIEKIVSKAVTTAIQREKESQFKAQSAYIEKITGITSHPEYENVKDVWAKHMENPRLAYAIQSGAIDPEKAFNDVVVGYYKGLATQAKDTITKLSGGGKAGIAKPPHVENGNQTFAPRGKSPDENNDKIQSYKEKVNKGHVLSENEELDAIAALL